MVTRAKRDFSFGERGADDRLSRAASLVRRTLRDGNEGSAYDSMVDGGEFSSGANWRAQMRQMRAGIEALGYTPRSFVEAVIARTDGRFAYLQGLTCVWDSLEGLEPEEIQ